MQTLVEPSVHESLFYEDERDLSASVARFFMRVRRAGDRLLVVATRAHWQAFATRLAADGLDAALLVTRGEAAFFDAREVLDSLVVNGSVDQVGFIDRVSRIVRDLSGPSGAPVRAYGEMVDLLWRDGQMETAHQLEELWNQTLQTAPVSMLCGYGLDAMARDLSGVNFTRICAAHTRVWPAGAAKFDGLDPASAVEMSRLQQRVRALEADLAHRHDFERAMRDSFRARAAAESAMKASRRELAGAVARVRHLGRQKDEFSAVVAHELRTPLAAIPAAVGVARNPASPDDVRHDALDVIDRQVRQIARLVDDLMDVSKISTGRLALRTAPTDVRIAIEAALDAVRPAIAAAGQRLTASISDEPMIVVGERARLTQILTNVVDNASKYTARGGHVAVEAEPDVEAGHVRIAVSDTGIGMTPEVLERVFDMFEQAFDARDRARGGLGIGLTVAQRLVHLHGGTIEANSAGLGRGSRFTLTFPLHDRATPLTAVLAPRNDTPAVSTRGLDMPTLRVLVVDDNVDSAEAMALLLKLYGHDVTVAHDGEAALAAAEADRPHAILLDIGLPRVDGYEVARRLRATDWAAGIFIVAVSGWGQDADRQRSREAGFDHHLVKPADPDALLKLLEDVRRSVAGDSAS